MSPKPLLACALLLLGAATAPAPTIYPAFHLPAGDYVLVFNETRETTVITHFDSITTYFDLHVESPTGDYRPARLTLRRMKTSSTFTNADGQTVHAESDTSTPDENALPAGRAKILLGLPFSFYISTAGAFVGDPGVDAFKKQLSEKNPSFPVAAIDQLTAKVYNPQAAFNFLQGILPSDPQVLGSSWKSATITPAPDYGPIDALFNNHFRAVQPAADGTTVAVVDYTAEGHQQMAPEAAARRHLAAENITLKISGTDERDLRTNVITKFSRRSEEDLELVEPSGEKLHAAIIFNHSQTLTPGTYKP